MCRPRLPSRRPRSTSPYADHDDGRHGDSQSVIRTVASQRTVDGNDFGAEMVPARFALWCTFGWSEWECRVDEAAQPGEPDEELPIERWEEFHAAIEGLPGYLR